MATNVKEMFASIAEKYDLLNNALSFGVHHLWRKKSVKLVGAKSGMKVLDCASGTGDFAIEFYNKGCEVLATDFCEPMLKIAEKKFAERNYAIKCEVADVTNLQFASEEFDVSSISFGIRNVPDVIKGLSEMARVVKSGGKVVILEFGWPKGAFKYVYGFYSKYMIPIIGKIISGNNYAYDYLPETAKKFPCADDFLDVANSLGVFKNSSYVSLTLGIAYIYVLEKK